MTRTRPDWLRREYVRAYVFACSHSSRHQRVQVCRRERGVAVWGRERPFPLSPSAPPPPRELCASGRFVPGSDPLAQVSGPGQLRSRAVFSSLTPPHPPCGPPTRRPLQSSPGCYSACTGSPDASCALQVPRSSVSHFVFPLLERGAYCHSLSASSTCPRFARVVVVLACLLTRPDVSPGDSRCHTALRPWVRYSFALMAILYFPPPLKQCSREKSES